MIIGFELRAMSMIVQHIFFDFVLSWQRKSTIGHSSFLNWPEIVISAIWTIYVAYSFNDRCTAAQNVFSLHLNYLILKSYFFPSLRHSMSPNPKQRLSSESVFLSGAAQATRAVLILPSDHQSKRRRVRRREAVYARSTRRSICISLRHETT